MSNSETIKIDHPTLSIMYCNSSTSLKNTEFYYFLLIAAQWTKNIKFNLISFTQEKKYLLFQSKIYDYQLQSYNFWPRISLIPSCFCFWKYQKHRRWFLTPWRWCGNICLMNWNKHVPILGRLTTIILETKQDSRQWLNIKHCFNTLTT